MDNVTFGRFTRFLCGCLLLLVCLIPLVAQERTAKIVEVLPSDQFIVEISGKQYRALNAEKVAELAKQKIELTACRDEQTKLDAAYKLAVKDVTIANLKADKEHASFVSTMALYEKERELRQATMQFIPHSQVGGFGGKVLRAMDSPWFQGFIKAAVPMWTAWQSTKR